MSRDSHSWLARSRSRQMANPETYTCTYVCILARFRPDDRLGKHVVKYSGPPLEARFSSGATLDSSLDRSFPSVPEELSRLLCRWKLGRRQRGRRRPVLLTYVGDGRTGPAVWPFSRTWDSWPCTSRSAIVSFRASAFPREDDEACSNANWTRTTGGIAWNHEMSDVSPLPFDVRGYRAERATWYIMCNGGANDFSRLWRAQRTDIRSIRRWSLMFFSVVYMRYLSVHFDILRLVKKKILLL